MRCGGDAGGDGSEVYQQLVKAATRISLLMNHKDVAYEKLVIIMDIIEDLVWLGGAEDRSQEEYARLVHVQRLDFVAVTNEILKREWQRTKAHLREDTVEVSALKSATER